MENNWPDEFDFLRALPDDPSINSMQMLDDAFGQSPAGFGSGSFDSVSNPTEPKRDSKVPMGHQQAQHQARGQGQRAPQGSISPDSSGQDSNSDNSTQRKRITSSQSSPSERFASHHTIEDIADLRNWEQSNVGLVNMGDAWAMRDPDYMMDDSCNVMEARSDINQTMATQFDFESAGTSPTAFGTRSITGLGSGYIPAGFRPAAATGPAARTPTVQPRFLLGDSPEDSPASMSMNSKEASPADPFDNSPSSGSGDTSEQNKPNNLTQTPVFDPFNFSSAARELGLSPSPATLSGGLPAAVGTSATLQSLTGSNISPYAVPAKGSHLPWLAVGPISAKSRVETQIGVKLTLYPMPAGVTKLHLPTHTISKPKLLAKPPVEKSPDMLELNTMLVCTSAMKDPEKRQRAFGRARAGNVVKKEPRRNSTGDMETDDDDPDKPLNGGEVHICQGCVTRERKRAARKKVKKAEEEDAWAQDEDKRAIVFNTNEIKEWQQPDQNPWGSPDGSVEAAFINQGPPPEGAMQIHAPMRIACYCRHHGEKLGFQVIFTIKDQSDHVVAQAISPSIMITDDHKTHGSASALAGLAGGMMLTDAPFAGAALFSGGQGFDMQPTFHQPSMPFRYSHSTNDLQGLQHTFMPPTSNFRNMNFPATDTLSGTTSATMTPRNLSRPASPSAQAPPSAKKRKSSGSSHHRIPTGLAMTRLNTAAAAPQTNAASGAPSTTVASTAASPFSPTFLPASDTSYMAPRPALPHQFSTGPPTPISNVGGTITPGYRSHSVENFSQPFFSAPSSAHPSRAPSPSSFTRPNASYFHQQQLQHQQMAQALSNLSAGLPTGLNPQQPPVIHKLIPAQGPTMGSIEVTCLGSGFCQGLEVMFGDRQATTTTFWGETSLVCLLPPASQAGTVPVTFKHIYQGQLPYASSSPAKTPSFTYIDEEDNQLYVEAMRAVCGKETGNSENYRTYARQLVANRTSPFNFMSGPMPHGLGQPNMNSEDVLLKCLDVIDGDDSSYEPHLNLKQDTGATMLSLACAKGYYRLVAGLLARGASINTQDKGGFTPLMMATLRGHAQIVRLLIRKGADTTLRNLGGLTAADQTNSNEGLNYVLKSGASRLSGSTMSELYSPGGNSTLVKSSRATPLPRRSSHCPSDNESRVIGLPDSSSGSSVYEDPWTASQVLSRRGTNAMPLETTVSMSHSSCRSEPSLLPPSAAMCAWRDQLALQIQHIHQNMQEYLPSLQVPALPPLAPMPDYQAYPFVLRMSSFIPRFGSSTHAPSIPTHRPPPNGKNWLCDLLASPPAYDEIFPQMQDGHGYLEVKKAAAFEAADDATMDPQCEPAFGITETGNSVVTGALEATIDKKSRSDSRAITHGDDFLRTVQSQKCKDDNTVYVCFSRFACIILFIAMSITLMNLSISEGFRDIIHIPTYAQQCLAGRLRGGA